jgi:hypothetical protein
VTAGPDARVTLDMEVEGESGSVATSVSGELGKTLVVGAQKTAGDGAVIAAVTPTLAPGGGVAAGGRP